MLSAIAAKVAVVAPAATVTKGCPAKNGFKLWLADCTAAPSVFRVQILYRLPLFDEIHEKPEHVTSLTYGTQRLSLNTGSIPVSATKSF